MYLRCSIETQASVKVSSRLAKSRTTVITDDPQENAAQPLAWYAHNLYYSCGLVAHLLDGRNGKTLHNSKYAFVCGLAHGFDKPMLMLAHAPYTPHLTIETSFECT